MEIKTFGIAVLIACVWIMAYILVGTAIYLSWEIAGQKTQCVAKCSEMINKECKQPYTLNSSVYLALRPMAINGSG
ncbi:hypothetical protein FJZ26_06100 [Candidatus Parvarchaeota archaeon]|nr:hypothetical protein [Candidatus Parvarchaeota archaeon]